MRPRKMILCAGPFPALQRTLRFRSFRPGSVNRALDTHMTAAGKPVNVARTIQALGGDARITGFKGGETGQELARCLRADSLSFRLTETRVPTRICQTILDMTEGATTELVEESGIPPPRAWAAWHALIRRWIPQAGLLVLSGTLPAGTDPDTWRILAHMAERHSIPVLIDSQGIPLLHALSAHPWLVKPNDEELVRTLALPRDNESTLWEGMKRLQREGAQNVLVSRGNRPALLLNRNGRRWRLRPPRVLCKNPIGCGDTVTGVLALERLEGRPLPRAARRAIAAATARCLNIHPGPPSLEEIAHYTRKTVCEPGSGCSPIHGPSRLLSRRRDR